MKKESEIVKHIKTKFLVECNNGTIIRWPSHMPMKQYDYAIKMHREYWFITTLSNVSNKRLALILNQLLNNNKHWVTKHNIKIKERLFATPKKIKAAGRLQQQIYEYASLLIYAGFHDCKEKERKK